MKVVADFRADVFTFLESHQFAQTQAIFTADLRRPPA
jgi:hypothetical protein